ncbi:MAG: 3-oxoacyl-ACP reductase [Rhodospirillaceae bacterium]|nr:3-oxoacyl-ACP reductase [Rhodospirillaceae bacterium]|tara:strand:- start:46 stop:795 length:750 start_codon:yes stop_codon:yes gene_type:complete
MQKVAIVTGAGAGIGKNAALSLWKAGYAVAVCARRLETLEDAIAEADVGSDLALGMAVDVGDPVAMRAFFDATITKFERLDVVFNNAGLSAPPVPIDEISDEQWRKVIDTNLSGSFYGMREGFRVMKAQSPKGGRIINNGSISAVTPRPYSAPYTSTKHAITGLTKSGNLDGRGHNIVVCQIDIGNAITPMTERMATGILQPDGSMQPEDRLDVQEVGDLVVHMANMPLDANIPFATIMAPEMPFFGRG